MKKRILFLLLAAFLLIACRAQEKPSLKSAKVFKDNREMLFGKTSLQQLFFDYPDWRVEMENYVPDSVILQKIAVFRKNLKIIILYATWCPDSKREVPRFLKIINQAGLRAYIKMSMWAVDRKLKLDNELPQKYQLERVPTFIFLYKGKEAGRIVESPQAFLLEEDVYNILKEIK